MDSLDLGGPIKPEDAAKWKAAREKQLRRNEGKDKEVASGETSEGDIPKPVKKVPGFLAFPRISRPAELAAWITSRRNRAGFPDALTFCAKPKLHGTNIGVRVSADGKVSPQSRTRDIFENVAKGDAKDNAGFCTWFKTWLPLGWDKVMPGWDIVVFGEFAGKSIFNTDAINSAPLGLHVFAIITVQPNFDASGETRRCVIADPALIRILLQPVFSYNADADKALFVIPEVCDIPHSDEAAAFVPPTRRFNVSNIASLDDPSADTKARWDDVMGQWNKYVDNVIAKQCPYTKHTFGLDGVGEGVVLMPVGIGGDVPLPMSVLDDFCVKIKTLAHVEEKLVNAQERKQAWNDRSRLGQYLQPARLAKILHAVEQKMTDTFDQTELRRIFGETLAEDVKKELQGADQSLRERWNDSHNQVLLGAVDKFMQGEMKKAAAASHRKLLEDLVNTSLENCEELLMQLAATSCSTDDDSTTTPQTFAANATDAVWTSKPLRTPLTDREDAQVRAKIQERLVAWWHNNWQK